MSKEKLTLTQRLQAAQAAFMSWRSESQQAHERGESIHNIPFPQNPFLTSDELRVVDQFYPEGKDTEIVLFIHPDVKLEEVREELGEIQ